MVFTVSIFDIKIYKNKKIDARVLGMLFIINTIGRFW